MPHSAVSASNGQSVPGTVTKEAYEACDGCAQVGHWADGGRQRDSDATSVNMIDATSDSSVDTDSESDCQLVDDVGGLLPEARRAPSIEAAAPIFAARAGLAAAMTNAALPPPRTSAAA